jgi:methionine-rich copper-binding protein CopC
MKQMLLVVLAVLVLAPLVWAHAFVDHAEPSVGSKMSVPPHLIKIWFTERLESSLSKIEVFDHAGTEIDKRDTKADPNNGQLLTVSLPQLNPGKYKVVWRVVSVDTHTTNGSFEFEVTE